MAGADRDPGAYVAWSIRADPVLAETLKLSAELCGVGEVDYVIKAIDFFVACTPEGDRTGSMIFLQDASGVPVSDPEVHAQIFDATVWNPVVSSVPAVTIEGIVPRAKAAEIDSEAQARGLPAHELVWRAIIHAAQAQNIRSHGYALARLSAQGTEMLSFE